jgi:hypothetical protein
MRVRNNARCYGVDVSGWNFYPGCRWDAWYGEEVVDVGIFVKFRDFAFLVKRRTGIFDIAAGCRRG